MKQTSKTWPAIRWVVMGVCGSGKSTIGQQLADACGDAYVEGDAFHPQANVDKMSAGQPLDDEDRRDWLRALREQIGRAREQGKGLVVSCSALKRSYRDLLREGDPALRFVHLDGPRALIAERLAARRNHYMPPHLLDSQLAALEPLDGEEDGLRLDIRQAPVQLVNAILASREDAA
ncbi:gluconokinase [Massilia sp. IC2-476]|uniref:gluconokinase n=1 Tax=Massilia sp. IC2-476 TaxID=2887199 RepID=UPI001D0FC15A|nr:gluconokinase [Massilia sp. IC2-476]MCC2973625.1 gluconokinase [Massilia sp. IC2-476]